MSKCIRFLKTITLILVCGYLFVENIKTVYHPENNHTYARYYEKIENFA